MKKIILPCLAVVLCTAATHIASAQTATGSRTQFKRCGTTEAIEKTKQANPEFAAEMARRNAEAMFVDNGSRVTARTSTLTGFVYIPVVVHVVYTNPNMVTEDQVDYLLDRMNKDYSGLNSDSTNATAFYSVRGHSKIQFVRARRDPNGNLTNGIERKVGTVGIYGTTYQRIKHASNGGLDPWDINKYYNMWVGADSSGQSLLGISPAIGKGNATETTSSTNGIDGICCNILGFSNGCFSSTGFNMGRTVVHEVGHNFGLYHTFEGCAAGADFVQLTTTQTLPSSLLASSDDTPGLSTSTSGCPVGAVASSCSSGVPNPPGKMYQNFMDYTNDACYSMFTKAQVNRMEYVLENFRSGYLTSDGATPPSTVPALDVAAVEVVSPGGSEFSESTCSIVNYSTPNCPGSFVPKVLIKNNGSSTLTNVTGVVTVNGVSTTPQVFSVNLVTDRVGVLTFPSQTLIAGNNTLTFTLSLPNGGTDLVVGNNTVTQNISIAISTAPVTEGFESSFPATTWTLEQLAGTGNWAKTTAAYKTGSASIKMDFYNYTSGTISALTTPPITFSPTYTTATLSFQYAHRAYSATKQDKLEVLVSTNCGSSWTSLWSRTDPALATVSGYASTAFTPTAAQWTTSPITIDLTAYKNQTVQVQFKATSNYGNNLYVDDVSITGASAVPLKLLSFTAALQPNKTVKLGWKTANETNSNLFVVEKSYNAASFFAMDTVIARTASTSNDYTSNDLQPQDGPNYYRLKQVDNDGRFTYSNIVSVNLKKNDVNAFVIQPNPVKDQLVLNINSKNADKVAVVVHDASGRTVLQSSTNLIKGSQVFTADASKLNAGVYYVSVIWGNEKIMQKFVKL